MKGLLPAVRHKAATRGIITCDRTARRLWFFGQRIHHGATGAGVAVVSGVAVATHIMSQRRGYMFLLAGTILMVHDGKDWPVWFRRGWQD